MRVARPLRIEYPGAFYHVTARGNEKRDVFCNDKDHHKFLSYLGSAHDRYGAVIHVYCLMNNHYHLLLETPLGNLSQIMHHINSSYTAYFNASHRRSGHLFQGRFKAILVEKDEYAQELSRYIHLNPVKAGLTDHPAAYHWSSYASYVDRTEKPEWLEVNLVLGYFARRMSDATRLYRKFVESMIDREYTSPLRNIVASTILGSGPFVAGIRETYCEGKASDREVPALRELEARPSIEEIEHQVTAVIGQPAKLVRNVSIHLAHQHTGLPLRDIGLHFGISESGVSQATRRVIQRMKEDTGLMRQVGYIKEELKMSRM